MLKPKGPFPKRSEVIKIQDNRAMIRLNNRQIPQRVGRVLIESINTCKSLI